MPLTKEQLKERREYIGSSDAASIMGYGRKTPEDIRLSKVVELEDDEQSEAAWLGTKLEQAIIAAAAESMGWELFGEEKFEHPKYLFLASNCDNTGVWRGTNGPEFCIECKAVGLCNPEFDPYKDWGESPHGSVPQDYWIQCQYQVAVGNFEVCYLVALIAGRGLNIYEIKRNREYGDEMIEYLACWWARHVVGGQECGAASLEVVERLPRRTLTVELPDDIGCRYIAAKDSGDKDKSAEARTAVLQALNGADAGRFSLGEIRVSRHVQERADCDRLKLKYPDIAKEVIKATPVTRLIYSAKETA